MFDGRTATVSSMCPSVKTISNRRIKDDRCHLELSKENGYQRIRYRSFFSFDCSYYSNENQVSK